MAKSILEQFKPTFESQTFENLLVEMQDNVAVVMPETADTTKFGFFVENINDGTQVQQRMGECQSLLSLLAVEVEGETNLFDRFSRNAEANGIAFEYTVGDTYLDHYGYVMVVDGDGQVKCIDAPAGFITNNRSVAVAFVYPDIHTLVFVDFKQSSIFRASLIPEELVK